MERVAMLLDERNKYLEKFETLNHAQLDKMSSGDFNGVEDFYRTREGILENINHLEKLVEAQLKAYPLAGEPISPSLRTRVQSALDARDSLVKSILDQDLEIISMIEEAKSKIIRELKDLRKGRTVIGAYRSGISEKHLDEKI